MYKVLCRVTANTRAAAKTLELQRRPNGETFYKLDYELVLIFGLTELQAYVSWKHKVSVPWSQSVSVPSSDVLALGKREKVRFIMWNISRARANIETEVPRVSFIKKIFDVFSQSKDKRRFGKMGRGNR